ncbi:PAS domain-containing protein [Mucilaginibacter antarcticus]|uniref:PAS domain-containing protein n=1 Tax=Mucilaginibacter antarcticus TaxID=1855725 RepID=UPI00363724D3
MNRQKLQSPFYSNLLPVVIYATGSLAILNANKMASNLYGYNENEFCDLTILEFCAPDEMVRLAEVLNEQPINENVGTLGAWTYLKKVAKLLRLK